jgi:hypothetical protein
MSTKAWSQDRAKSSYRRLRMRRRTPAGTVCRLPTPSPTSDAFLVRVAATQIELVPWNYPRLTQVLWQAGIVQEAGLLGFQRGEGELSTRGVLPEVDAFYPFLLEALVHVLKPLRHEVD